MQSALGETLRAEVEVTSITAEEASSLALRVAPPEAYRAAGVEYNAVLPSANVQLVRRPDGKSVLRVSSDRAVLEPFVDVIIEATWASGRLVREYTLLFDPPGSRQASAVAPGTAPVISPAPGTAPGPGTASAPPVMAPAAPAPAAPPAPAAAPPVASPVSPPLAAGPSSARTAEPARSPAPAKPTTTTAGQEVDQYRVRNGDTLGRIAGRTQRPGVSLDQMLVSLFRANPQAFMAENMNRLRSGSVLTVPSAEEAAKANPDSARELIIAQSADFAAYRQRLAAGASTVAEGGATRQARGQVQTKVDDRKQAAAAAPDRLTLSQGGLKGGAASAAESRVSKETERKAADARLAELARNVDDLKKLQGANPAAAKPTPAQAAASAAAAKSGTVVAAAPAPVPAPAPPPPAAPATVAAPPPAVVLPPPPVVASAPAPAVVAAASAPAATAARPPAAASAPKVVAAAPSEPESPGLLDSLSENSLLLPAAGVLVALLGGLGLYRLRGRMRKPAGETSFLESRLQPDSFFGASGGQRVDTREAVTSNSSSSMSYSLSQLDAIGDVDPVAEADVYLAYGRDLQAEEILKEAMRATPERLAIRSKLLEVYAKRRDTKGFELLATQLFNITRGSGEEWSKAQALGLSIDPDNSLYQPGGQPDEVRGSGGNVVEALGASTVPYTAPAPAPSFQPAVDATLDGPGLDLDLELPMGASGVPARRDFASDTLSSGARYEADDMLDLDIDGPNAATMPQKRPTSLDPAAAAAAPARNAPADNSLDFDLGSLSLDAPTNARAQDTSADFDDFALEPDDRNSDMGLGDADPLARKLELAEEFRQIGDLEGARDLLEEVLAKAAGPLKGKAQSMLDQLS